MFETSVKTGDSGIIPITQGALANLLVALLSLTVLLMLFFVQIDFEYLFGSDAVAMKVGKSVVFLEDFYEIKKGYGERGQNMSDQLFAQELLEIIMLAEEGRRLKLDRTPEFRRRIDAFDLAARRQANAGSLRKAVFLIEELAQATRDYIIEESLRDFAPEISELEIDEPIKRLHLKTILVRDEETADQLLADYEESADFDALNSNFSISPYKAVGGDIGWKREEDLPAGVFNGLYAAEPNSLISGFEDEHGVHLFLVADKPEFDRALAIRTTLERARKDHEGRALFAYLQVMRGRIDHYISSMLIQKKTEQPLSEGD